MNIKFRYIFFLILSWQLVDLYAGQGVELKSTSWGSTYVTYINGEPVAFSDGAELTMHVGYPLRMGTNDLVMELNFPTSFKHPLNFPPRIGMFFFCQDTPFKSVSAYNWKTLDVLQKDWMVGSIFGYTNYFTMKNIIEDPGFEILTNSPESLVEQCKTITEVITDIFEKGDQQRFLKAFGLTMLQITNEYPRLLNLFPNTNLTDVSALAGKANMEGVCGRRLILLHAKIGSHLLVLSDKKSVAKESPNLTARKYAEFRHDGEYYVDSFLFGRINGKWLVNIMGVGWTKFSEN